MINFSSTEPVHQQLFLIINHLHSLEIKVPARNSAFSRGSAR